YKVAYTAGAQGAITELKIDASTSITGKTSNNIHAELDVLNQAYTQKYIKITGDGIISIANDGLIKANEISINTYQNTNDSDDMMDNCGYCTFFLYLLGLTPPKPTGSTSIHAGSDNRRGGYTLPYPLPEFIKQNKYVLKRLLTKGGNKQDLNFVEQYLEDLFSDQKKEQEKKDELQQIWYEVEDALTKKLKDQQNTKNSKKEPTAAAKTRKATTATTETTAIKEKIKKQK
ncbi:hypothetical protein GR268_42385, partial [Rhizobium leguminosarum]|nr:hypothetical protein [Rhizobium leguminosarum]